MTQITLTGALSHTDKHSSYLKLPRPLLRRKPSSIKVKIASHSKAITTFPVRVHKDDSYINQGALIARKTFKDFTPKTEFRSHSAGPYGNFFSTCWPNGKAERVKLATEIIESLWVYDDVMEDFDHAGAVKIHASVRDTLVGVERPSKKNMIATLFKDFGLRLNQMDKQGAPRVLGALKAYLDNYDSQKTPFDTIQKYTEYRILNVGYGIMDSFMQWTMGLHLNEAETDEAHNFQMSAGRVMGLTNDLYSWNVERTESVDAEDRKWNAVPVIMQQYELNEEDAIVFLQGLVVHHEKVTRELGQVLLRRFAYSSKMTKYVENVGLMLGGNCFWSATCPRYNPHLI
ncbi:putative geranylgeranyl pyrophosphate synthase [Rosellinia necatrix]|uniref:Putative geranylgeranyl pyrophosphate synthase n=1 Tax=Rosellinia necatrix TaxID=77044 RepID=A0A1W2TR91_ROSNE|nr:putative geranylgeranyl pyrophosphate synthase [Rosellinia necatrix]